MNAPHVGVALPPHLELPVRDYVGIARSAEATGFDRLWATEAVSADAFSLLTACAAETSRIEFATGVLPIQVRSPAVTAQGALAVQDYSQGRFTLGLGVSTKVMVTGWNGLPWDGKLARIREYVDLVKALMRGESVDNPGGRYPLRDAKLRMHVPAPPPAVLVAALGPRMLELAGSTADGALLNYAGAAAVKELVPVVRAAGAAKAPRVSAFVRACVVDESVTAARSGAQREVMAKVVVPAYRRAFEAHGWRDACARAMALWEAGERRAAAESLPDEMTESIVAFGSAAVVRERFDAYRAAGLDELILYAVSTKRGRDEARVQFEATLRAVAPAG